MSRPVDPHKVVMTGTRLSGEIVAEIDRQAEVDESSRAEVLRAIVEAWYKRQKR